MNNQGEKYIEKEADLWFDRNNKSKHNCFTEYLIELFSKISLQNKSIAELGVGRGNNIFLLSNFVKTIDGYDGSKKSIKNILQISENVKNIDGKVVNLASEFSPIRKYDIVILGFFTYMISNEEFKILVNNCKKMLNKNGYIFIYDFLNTKMSEKKDVHNNDFTIYKRNINFYNSEFSDFNLHDFRLWDNRKLREYANKDKQIIIDEDIDSDDYNWTFSSLYKIKD